MERAKRKLPVVERLWDYKGYRCAVLFQPTGHRCGYVEIPKESKFFNVDYNDIPIVVHGGLTYGRDYLTLVSSEEDNRYWIGWDYAHFGDNDDDKTYEKYYGRDLHWETILECNLYGFNHIAYLEEVLCDCENVVDQLIRIEKTDK